MAQTRLKQLVSLFVAVAALSVEITNASSFPFKIDGSKFTENNKPVFLNIIGYQPLEPGQNISDEIRENRIKDDLRRWRAYQGGTDPIVLRVYPGPTLQEPNRPRMPKSFYDSVRNLGFWIIRDIYVSDYYWEPNAMQDANDKIDNVIAEVNEANTFDLIFAWEIGNEFEVHNGNVAGLENFICHMCDHIKERVKNVGGSEVSDWVTWGASTKHDSLRTWNELSVLPECLNYISHNVYSYEPDRIRDHQAGPITGTPYQGYLSALKQQCPNEPLIISEIGLADSNSPEDTGDHARLHPWYPAYRKGGLTSEQVAEGLADRYWDAHLLQDINDPNIVIAGMAVFEWNDEWHKGESPPGEDNGLPEEHFGLGRFEKKPEGNKYQLRYKLQQETIRNLYTLRFDNDVNIIESVFADNNTLLVDANTWVHAIISETAARPVRIRWETNRGYIIGDPNAVYDPNRHGEPNSVKFYAGGRWLGPAMITAIAIDANGNVDTASSCINIETSEPNSIEILTLGINKASGRIYNVNLDQYKLVCYIQTNKMYIQPYEDMKSIWIRSDGYWWTKVSNNYDGDLICWLVPEYYDPPNNLPSDSPPPSNTVATAVMTVINDGDNDLLPDACEPNIGQDRYDDLDEDRANNLEEFLAGTSMVDGNDNDSDKDGLLDNWERHFLGDIRFYDANDDPDGDGLTNSEELALGLHPVRVAADKDRDRLPDLWEFRWFGDIRKYDTNGNPNDDCNNLDEYEVGLDPNTCVGNLDCDGDVDIYDYSRFALHWLDIDCNAPDWCDKADLNRNGEVNLLDLYVLTENWLLQL